MGAFVSSSDDEGEEEDQQKGQTQRSIGVSEEPVDATEAELRTITLNPMDKQNLRGKLKQLLSEWYKSRYKCLQGLYKHLKDKINVFFKFFSKY